MEQPNDHKIMGGLELLADEGWDRKRSVYIWAEWRGAFNITASRCRKLAERLTAMATWLDQESH